jgi:hypothetical protein
MMPSSVSGFELGLQRIDLVDDAGGSALTLRSFAVPKTFFAMVPKPSMRNAFLPDRRSASALPQIIVWGIRVVRPVAASINGGKTAKAPMLNRRGT